MSIASGPAAISQAPSREAWLEFTLFIESPGHSLPSELSKRSAGRRQCFLVDYQLPTDPHNIEVAKQIAAGQIGQPAVIASRYFGGGWPHPLLTTTEESPFQHSIWCNDITLGGSHHVNACIHAIDGVLWALGRQTLLRGPESGTGGKSGRGSLSWNR